MIEYRLLRKKSNKPEKIKSLKNLKKVLDKQK